MKKSIRLFAFLVLCIGTCSLLLSCANNSIDGTYVSDGLASEGILIFEKDGNVVYKVSNIVGGEQKYLGSYTLDRKENTIHIDFDSKEKCLLSGSWSFSENKENQSITIGSITYKKQSNS